MLIVSGFLYSLSAVLGIYNSILPDSVSFSFVLMLCLCFSFLCLSVRVCWKIVFIFSCDRSHMLLVCVVFTNQRYGHYNFLYAL